MKNFRYDSDLPEESLKKIDAFAKNSDFEGFLAWRFKDEYGPAYDAALCQMALQAGLIEDKAGKSLVAFDPHNASDTNAFTLQAADFLHRSPWNMPYNLARWMRDTAVRSDEDVFEALKVEQAAVHRELNTEVIYTNDTSDLIYQNADAFIEAHDVTDFLDWRFGDFDNYSVAWGEALGELLPRLGIEEYEDEPVDKHNPPAIDLEDYDDAEVFINNLLKNTGRSWEDASFKHTVREWMYDTCRDNNWFVDSLLDDEQEDFYSRLDDLGVGDRMFDEQEPVIVLGSNLTWQNLSGFKVGYPDTSMDIIDMLHGDYDYTAKVMYEKGKHYLTASVGSHDGTEGFTIIPASWLKEALREDDNIRHNIEDYLWQNYEEAPILDVYIEYGLDRLDAPAVCGVAGECFEAGQWRYAFDNDEEKANLVANLVRHTPEEIAAWAQTMYERKGIEAENGFDVWEAKASMRDALLTDTSRGLPQNAEIKALAEMLNYGKEEVHDRLLHDLLTTKTHEQVLNEVRSYAKKMAKGKD